MLYVCIYIFMSTSWVCAIVCMWRSDNLQALALHYGIQKWNSGFQTGAPSALTPETSHRVFSSIPPPSSLPVFLFRPSCLTSLLPSFLPLFLPFSLSLDFLPSSLLSFLPFLFLFPFDISPVCAAQDSQTSAFQLLGLRICVVVLAC